MTVYPYSLSEGPARQMGLVVLQADETIESDFRRLVPRDVRLMVSRVPSGADVTPETLQAMADHMTAAARLFPMHSKLDAVGYGCTSGTAQIGAARIAELIKAGVETRAVTEPVSALIAACKALGVSRLAFLSPYVEDVSARLREVIAAGGVETAVFGTFAEPTEANVARIDGPSVTGAAQALVPGSGAEALFLSCTNLRTLDLIEPLEDALGMPVLSSNLVLAWHMLRLAGGPASSEAPGALFAARP